MKQKNEMEKVIAMRNLKTGGLDIDQDNFRKLGILSAQIMLEMATDKDSDEEFVEFVKTMCMSTVDILTHIIYDEDSAEKLEKAFPDMVIDGKGQGMETDSEYSA